MKREAWRWFAALAAVFLATLSTCADAVILRATPDEELAQKPIIVVARWPRGRVVRHDRTWRNAILEAEAHTFLIVDRVIKGNITSGRYKLLYGLGVGWEEDGTMPDAAENVTQPNIWFLSQKRSWDEIDPTLYLSLDNFNGVQPLELEPYFAVLERDDRDARIADLLNSKNPVVVGRALDYINGRDSFYDSWGEAMPNKPKPSRRLIQHAGAVEHVLDRREPWLRSEAAAVYAALSGTKGIPRIQRLLSDRNRDVRWTGAVIYGTLAGKQSVPRMRQLLGDRDPAVRAVAVGLLVRQRDVESVDRLCRVVAGIGSMWRDCSLMESMAAWGDTRLVPALISCLQTDGSPGCVGDDPRIPAVTAQAALQQITGYVFPFDVRASRRAWAKARRIADTAGQLKRLASSLGNDPKPLQATAVEDRGQLAMEVTNRSRQPIALSKGPIKIECDYDRGSDRWDGDSVVGRGSFIRMRPGESIRFRIRMPDGFLTADATTNQIKLLYSQNGNGFGVNAWVGLLKPALTATPASPGHSAAPRGPA